MIALLYGKPGQANGLFDRWRVHFGEFFRLLLLPLSYPIAAGGGKSSAESNFIALSSYQRSAISSRLLSIRSTFKKADRCKKTSSPVFDRYRRPKTEQLKRRTGEQWK
jgi:hypothetical protein